MQETFKKIIEKLEEIQIENTCSDCPHKEKCDEVQENISDEKTDLCGATIKALAIEIVKQESEKLGTDTNVGSNGWIPLSERLPNQDGEFTDVLITCKSMADGVFVQSAEFYIDSDGEPVFDALYHYESVLAWHPLPEPYQPKGE